MATASNVIMELGSEDVATGFKEFSVLSLRETLEEIRTANTSISDEIVTLKSYVNRVQPEDPGLSDSEPTTSKYLQLSDLDKFDIVTQELDEIQKLSAIKEDVYNKFNAAHEATISEAGIRILELHRAISDFDKDIAKGDLNKQTGLMEGEKVLKYYEHKLKLRDTLKDKLCLKSASLKAKRTKLQSQIKQKEEAGEIRCEVDFEQLKIENKQCNEKFEDKNQELLKLKLSAGKTLQVLGVYKKKLHAVSGELSSIEGEIESRKELLKRVTAEKDDVLQDKLKAEKINFQSRKKVEDYRVPDVMDYVSERACIYELSRTLRAWERKVEIAEMALRSHRQNWKKMSSSASKGVLLQW